MDDTLFGADPSEMGVGDEISPGLTPIGGQGREGFADDAFGEGGDGVADNVVPATDGEGHTVAGEGRRGGVDDAVGGRVVSCSVHGIAARLVEGGGKANITRGDGGDGEGGHCRG